MLPRANDPQTVARLGKMATALKDAWERASDPAFVRRMDQVEAGITRWESANLTRIAVTYVLAFQRLEKRGILNDNSTAEEIETAMAPHLIGLVDAEAAFLRKEFTDAEIGDLIPASDRTQENADAFKRQGAGNLAKIFQPKI